MMLVDFNDHPKHLVITKRYESMNIFYSFFVPKNNMEIKNLSQKDVKICRWFCRTIAKFRSFRVWLIWILLKATNPRLNSTLLQSNRIRCCCFELQQNMGNKMNLSLFSIPCKHITLNKINLFYDIPSVLNSASGASSSLKRVGYFSNIYLRTESLTFSCDMTKDRLRS